jgi:hypothetical protein
LSTSGAQECAQPHIHSGHAPYYKKLGEGDRERGRGEREEEKGRRGEREIKGRELEKEGEKERG